MARRADRPRSPGVYVLMMSLAVLVAGSPALCFVRPAGAEQPTQHIRGVTDVPEAPTSATVEPATVTAESTAAATEPTGPVTPEPAAAAAEADAQAQAADDAAAEAQGGAPTPGVAPGAAGDRGGRPDSTGPEPTLHIIGVTDVPAALHAAAAANLNVIDVISIIDAIVVEGPAQAAKGLAHAPFVRFVEPDSPDAVWTQEDTLGYGVSNIEAEIVWGGSPKATSVIPGRGGAGAKVAVVDTGIDCGHPDLALNCMYGPNFTVKGNKLAFDDHGHGTHVAGIIAARDNGFGVIGVAPEATLYAVKVLDANGSGPWSSVASGIVWAIKNGMDVINMSLGGSSSSQAVADAVKAASDAGILVVSAAGNAGCCDTVLSPAKLPGSMAVAAVDANDQRAPFSSTGQEVDVAAPGVAILSTVPTGTCKLCDRSGYRSLSGTSMATPHVSGTGALLMSRGLTNVEAWRQISGTATDLGSPGFDLFYGWGRVDALSAVTNSPSFPPPGDVTPPTVAFTSPLDGYIVEQTNVTVSVGATDDHGLYSIELQICYVTSTGMGCWLAASSPDSPLTYRWQTKWRLSGTYTLNARAIDQAGHAVSTSITVTKP